MKLEFDENKEYTIEELEQLRSEYWDINNTIHEKITEARIKDYNFTDKYVYSEEYGYMFVTWQKYDTKSIWGDERMFFQGLSISANLGPYRDDAWFDFNALNEWYIPIETFIRDVEDGKFKEITKEEFVKNLKENLGKLEKEIDEWIIYTENYNKTDET